jgi:hypothetical protein
MTTSIRQILAYKKKGEMSKNDHMPPHAPTPNCHTNTPSYTTRVENKRIREKTMRKAKKTKSLLPPIKGLSARVIIIIIK